ncbi:MAG: MotA/TolQ/ExbB proton channel family protein [Verrucomicrobiota bacterium]
MVGLFEIVKMGGHIMWFIFIGSVLAVAVFAERMVFYHRCTVRVNDFLKGISRLLRKERWNEALERCDEAYGPAIRVVQVAILKRHLKKQELKEIIQEVGQLEMPKLEANLALLATIGQIAPLLGLLGTVTGMIQVFMEMNQSMGAAPISDLAGGIWEALITTAGGLALAIPCYVAYNYLAARLNAIVTDIERSGIEVLQILYDDPGVEEKEIKA